MLTGGPVRPSVVPKKCTMPSASGERVSESDTPFQLKLFMGAQMCSRGYTWSLVLAGGEGSRLRSLTTDGAGASVPKQFCSLFGATTLLEDALNRGRAVADGGRVCAIVARAVHSRCWMTANQASMIVGASQVID